MHRFKILIYKEKCFCLNFKINYNSPAGFSEVNVSEETPNAKNMASNGQKNK